MGIATNLLTGGGSSNLISETAYGTCDTAAATAAKIVTMSDFDAFTNGMHIAVTFTYGNTATSPTLNVNNKGAKPIYPTDANLWVDGATVEFVYNTTNVGTGCWAIVNRDFTAPITDLKEDLFITNKNIASGNTKLTQQLFHNSNERNLTLYNPIYVEAGNQFITKQSTLWQRWQIKDDNGNVLEEYKGLYDKIDITDHVFTFEHTGWFYITIANGYNWGNSSAIVVTDMTADLSLVNNNASVEIGKIKADIDILKEYSELVFSKRIDVTANASTENTYFYYPCSFLKGHTYYVKIKFSAFVSNKNRKYSLRTSTYTSISSAYFVQMIAAVDGTNPTVGEEYVYKFVATSRTEGHIAKYLALELNVTGTTSCDLEVYSVKAEDALPDGDAYSDIVTLNHEVPDLIRQGIKPLDRATTLPLSLFHFSDIHGNQNNLSRIVEMKKSLASLVDDTICTGDIVVNNYSADCMDFWDAVDGAEDILLCLGNHDLADGEHGYSSDQIGQATAYAKYISPYISNWGVISAGSNLTYWYKDYATRKVRVIALNYLLTGAEQTAQNSWLASRLAEAKTNNYAVVILEHTPLNSFTLVPCNFSVIGLSWGYNEFPTVYQDTVQDFIDGGGEFACYLAGHAHRDLVGYNSNYPSQLCIAITTAQTTGLDNDQRRQVGEKSQDAGNIVLIDTVTKTVKLIRVGADMDCYVRGRNLLSINYNTKQIIANS